MADGLQRLASTIQVDVFAATHSATLMEVPDAHLLHVTRGRDGNTTVHPMSGVSETNLEALGMTKTELLQLTRVFVLVEGLHDQIVIEETCSNELAVARARIIPLRGGRHAPSLLDAQFLLRFTDAAFLVVLDAVPQATVDAAWDDALAAWGETHHVDEVERRLKASLPGREHAENLFLRELMSDAIAAGEERRLHFRTLANPDVLYYLPVSAFTKRAVSWEGLADQHANAVTEQKFKPWLASQYQFELDAPQIRRAAQSLDTLHPHLVTLAHTLTTFSSP